MNEMKVVIIFASLFVVALAHPKHKIVNLDSDVGHEKYSYNIDTSDGTHREENGHLEPAGSKHKGIVVKGAFSFIADDGKTYAVQYVADENGFQPKGAHLPTGAR